MSTVNVWYSRGSMCYSDYIKHHQCLRLKLMEQGGRQLVKERLPFFKRFSSEDTKTFLINTPVVFKYKRYEVASSDLKVTERQD